MFLKLQSFFKKKEFNKELLIEKLSKLKSLTKDEFEYIFSPLIQDTKFNIVCTLEVEDFKQYKFTEDKNGKWIKHEIKGDYIKAGFIKENDQTIVQLPKFEYFLMQSNKTVPFGSDRKTAKLQKFKANYNCFIKEINFTIENIDTLIELGYEFKSEFLVVARFTIEANHITEDEDIEYSLARLKENFSTAKLTSSYKNLNTHNGALYQFSCGTNCVIKL